MTGTLIDRNGVWYCVLHYKDEFGNRKQKWISTGLKVRGNKRKATKMLESFIQQNASLDIFEKQTEAQPIQEFPLYNKQTIKQHDISFGEYVKSYVESRKNSLSPTVFLDYSAKANNVAEFFGNIKLTDITTNKILEYYQYLRDNNGIKNISIKHYSNVIRPTLRMAYRKGLIAKNPYDDMPPLKKEKVSYSFYNEQEMQTLFEAIQNHPMEIPIKIAATYGFRRSELLGLKWQAIDFINKTISVEHKVLVAKCEVYLSDTLKTDSSRRTLPLLPQVEEMLLKQKQQIEKNIAFFGNAYNFKYKEYIFVHPNGDLILPDCLTHNFAKILKRNNLKHIRFHDLRHSCASILLAKGAQMKQIQEWLGHSSYDITANIYSHLDYSAKIDTANKISAALNLGEAKTSSATNLEPEIPEELLAGYEQQQREEEIDEELDILKKQMNRLGLTKLSELFAFIENNRDHKKDDFEM